MLPGMGGMDARSMARMMQQMGIKNEEVPARRVIIEQEDGQIVIDSPQITKITMQGQVSFQIAGAVSIKSVARPEDVKLVAESAGVGEKEAADALAAANGDIAEAILSLKKE
ncbi:MAG: nascent polypeptide-associated complex protein [Candidatus Micrarchaeota archaeon]|nr:nascent polypeptide-associated complex protein [Candidatus Micrarchaeota archaeon]